MWRGQGKSAAEQIQAPVDGSVQTTHNPDGQWVFVKPDEWHQADGASWTISDNVGAGRKEMMFEFVACVHKILRRIAARHHNGSQ